MNQNVMDAFAFGNFAYHWYGHDEEADQCVMEQWAYDRLRGRTRAQSVEADLDLHERRCDAIWS